MDETRKGSFLDRNVGDRNLPYRYLNTDMVIGDELPSSDSDFPMKTKTEVQRPPMFALVDEFKWRDKHGNFHKVEDMETRHLFHVVRMVWDHSMPREWQTRFKNRYRFPEFYSEDYMALAIRLMLPALFHRRDITPEMMYWLEHMDRCLRNKKVQIPFVLKIGYEPNVPDTN